MPKNPPTNAMIIDKSKGYTPRTSDPRNRQAEGIVPALDRSGRLVKSSKGPTEGLLASPPVDKAIAIEDYVPESTPEVPKNRMLRGPRSLRSSPRLTSEARVPHMETETPGRSDKLVEISSASDSEAPVTGKKTRLPKWAIKNPTRKLTPSKTPSWKANLSDEEWEYAESTASVGATSAKKRRVLLSDTERLLTTKQRAEIAAKSELFNEMSSIQMAEEVTRLLTKAEDARKRSVNLKGDLRAK